MNESKQYQLLTNSITAALKAGEEILKIYQTDDFNVEMKSDNSPLTKADKASHKIISGILNNQPIIQSLNQNRHPEEKEIAKRLDDSSIGKFPILSEEGKNIPYEERKNWKQYWLIDPLDGTKEFIKRNGEFTVNIALIENNQPVMGVIYAPEYESKINDNSKKEKDQSVIPDPDPESQPIQIQNENGNLNSLIRQFAQFENFAGTLYFAAKGLGAFKANYNNEKISIKKLSITQSSNHPTTQLVRRSVSGGGSSNHPTTQSSNQPITHTVGNRREADLERNNNAISKLSKLIAVGSRSHSSEEEKTKLKELGVTETISVGSSLKFCMVAEGKAQVYYRHGPTMEWDVAAGYAIAKEAGAKITGLQFNKENLLNSSFLVIS